MILEDRVALVTGGGSGIGFGISKALSKEGCRVVVCGRNIKKLNEAADRVGGEARVLAHSCDVTDRRSVRELLSWTHKQLGPVDIAVNSAGINVNRRSMRELAAADFDRILETNCTGFFNVLQAVLPGMRGRGDGLIINISSVAGKRAFKVAGPSYCASKFAATALGTSVGLEERQNGVRITNIYPGEVDTPLIDERPEPVPEERKEKMVHPGDIAAMVVAIAKLPSNVIVPELVITPLYQEYL